MNDELNNEWLNELFKRLVESGHLSVHGNEIAIVATNMEVEWPMADCLKDLASTYEVES